MFCVVSRLEQRIGLKLVKPGSWPGGLVCQKKLPPRQTGPHLRDKPFCKAVRMQDSCDQHDLASQFS